MPQRLHPAVWTMVLALVIGVEAYQGMPIRPLQVVGRYLKDDTGRIVMLHGWMAPSGWYWNGRAFPDPVEFTPDLSQKDCYPGGDDRLAETGRCAKSRCYRIWTPT
ncbi:hypothetical protein NXS98_03210 [Fontisphaera persica]|uniref:hypothetical protein n=1 Tax=Fontisphaera persica TaxID=2974023 RepID=UPI0024C0D5DC|nr:hypothetical protein [Fontisphaera persica]WCJ60150.1 hypothetical protein NXS98_03210 [Fontisphaera persica]